MQAPFPSGEGCRRSGGGVCLITPSRSAITTGGRLPPLRAVKNIYVNFA
ncbi:MAG: hypothetical protein FWH14_07230 [Oscillospiraceae bacterium]|nr:hypothetical protein [Oscillospiraceae bacterium]